jgi:membrane protease YdiL (CAAX protease family)
MLLLILAAVVLMFAPRALRSILIMPTMDWFEPRLSLINRTEPLMEILTLTLALLPPMLCVVIGEQILFRRLFINYLANKFTSTTKAWMAAILISSIIFGLGHFWKDHHGTMSPSIGWNNFPGGFYFSGINLWPPIIAL